MSEPGIPSVVALNRRRRGAGTITLRKLARLAGVAPITASRALNTPEQVASETLKRVCDAVARLALCPTASRGLWHPPVTDLWRLRCRRSPALNQMVEALISALDEAGYQLMLGQSSYADSPEGALLDASSGCRPDGIVVTGIMHTSEGAAVCRLVEFPLWKPRASRSMSQPQVHPEGGGSEVPVPALGGGRDPLRRLLTPRAGVEISTTWYLPRTRILPSHSAHQWHGDLSSSGQLHRGPS